MRVMSESLKKTTIKNVSYNAIGKGVATVFQSVANIVLSQELVAADYGVAGFAMICVTFMKNCSSFGINNAAVHANDFDEKGKSTAFTLRLLLSVAAFAITIALSGLADHFIKHNSITLVIRVLAFAILIDNLGAVSTICLERNLKYSVISLAEAASLIASSVIAVVLALNGFKYWSIVYGFIASTFVSVFISYFYMPYKFKFALDIEIAKQYLRYGSYVFYSSLLYFAIMNMDNFIVGSVSGAAQLGYYAIAFNWGSMVCMVMWSVVFSLLFPTLMKMKDDPVRMKQAYLNIMQYTALISLLFNVGLFCVADNFLFSVLGKGTDKWLPSLQTLRIFCIYGVIRSLILPAPSFMMALGYTRIQFKATLLAAIIEIILVYPAIKFGSIEVVALVVLFSFATQLIIYLPALKQTSNIKTRELGMSIWPSIASGLAMFLCYYGLNDLFPHSLMKLAGSMLLLAFVYIVTYGILTKWKFYIQIKELLFAGR